MINILNLDILNKLLHFLKIEEILILENTSKEIKYKIESSYNNYFFKKLIIKKYPNIVNFTLPYYKFFKKLSNNRYYCFKCDKLLDNDFNITLIIYLDDNNNEIVLHNYHIRCIKDSIIYSISIREDGENLLLSYKCPLTNKKVVGWKSKLI